MTHVFVIGSGKARKSVALELLEPICFRTVLLPYCFFLIDFRYNEVQQVKPWSLPFMLAPRLLTISGLMASYWL